MDFALRNLILLADPVSNVETVGQAEFLPKLDLCLLKLVPPSKDVKRVLQRPNLADFLVVPPYKQRTSLSVSMHEPANIIWGITIVPNLTRNILVFGMKLVFSTRDLLLR